MLGKRATQFFQVERCYGGIGDDWAKAVALGLLIDPSNPLFSPVQAAPAFLLSDCGGHSQ